MVSSNGKVHLSHNIFYEMPVQDMNHSVARVIVLKLKRVNHVTGLLITPVNLHRFGDEE